MIKTILLGLLLRLLLRLLLLLSLLALLALLKNFIDESRRVQLTLMQRCLMASLAMHMLLAWLLMGIICFHCDSLHSWIRIWQRRIRDQKLMPLA